MTGATAYEIAYVDAAVVTALHRKERDPFWQQAYTWTIRWVKTGAKLAGYGDADLCTVADLMADDARLDAWVDRVSSGATAKARRYSVPNGAAIARGPEWAALVGIVHQMEELSGKARALMQRMTLGAERAHSTPERPPGAGDASTAPARKASATRPLAGERIVFLGALSMTRMQAASYATKAGAQVCGQVSGQTTVVVTGKVQSGALAFDDLEKRRAAGQALAVLDEAAFRARVAAH